METTKPGVAVPVMRAMQRFTIVPRRYNGASVEGNSQVDMIPADCAERSVSACTDGEEDVLTLVIRNPIATAVALR